MNGIKPVRVPLVFLILVACAFAGQFFLLSNMLDRAIKASITEASQSANSSVTRLFINEIYPRLSDIIPLEETETPATNGLKGEELRSVDRSVRKFMLGTDILKIKIYTQSGLTMYSSDPSQIGEDKSDNPAFISASQGIPGSQVTHRGKFDALDGEVFNRDLVASYIPIRNPEKRIIGVAEVYTDRTQVIEQSANALIKIQAVMGMTMTLILTLVIAMAWTFWARLVAVATEDPAVQTPNHRAE
ncbi:MAG: hypothetical protein GY762_17980 [Proteobacteria bacterium]|nr:hypothetical protein [Pseudomonadota bacterium]